MEWAGIDLREFHVHRCCFDNSNLQGALFCITENSSFRNTDLSNVELFIISGSDFTGACLKGIDWSKVYYNKNNPPVGLDDDILSLCRLMPKEPPLVTGGNDDCQVIEAKAVIK